MKSHSAKKANLGQGLEGRSLRTVATDGGRLAVCKEADSVGTGHSPLSILPCPVSGFLGCHEQKLCVHR